MWIVDNLVQKLSTLENFGNPRKIKLYTKLSTLSTVITCGLLDLHNDILNTCSGKMS